MKYKSLSLLIIVLFSACTIGAQNRKKVGIVLSGGGAKGVAHIGALKVIEEAGIPIDYVVGTSMGAIVGGLYSIGYTPMEKPPRSRELHGGFLFERCFVKTSQSASQTAPLSGEVARRKRDGEVFPSRHAAGNIFSQVSLPTEPSEVRLWRVW